jgi:predicted nucleotidyltransferase
MESDVDLAVEGLAADTRDAASADLEHLLGSDVDLVRIEAAPETFRRRIESEGESL